ncbi:8640_t:CDS:2 [Rhizophagus irregularis]|nr:8640_t:CDS:2 [Rhizophagus irregularis]
MAIAQENGARTPEGSFAGKVNLCVVENVVPVLTGQSVCEQRSI